MNAKEKLVTYETLCEIYNIIDRLTRMKPNNLK